MKNRYITKSEFIYKMFFIISISIFFLPFQIRVGILGSKLGNINFILAGVLIIFILVCKEKFYTNKIIITICTICYVLGIYFLYNKKINEIIYMLTSFMLPMFIINIKVNKECFEKIFKIFLLCLNITIFAITIIWLIDISIGNKIMLYISNFTSNRLAEQIREMSFSTGTKRLYSYMGHPLFNTQLYLMFYILNMIHGRYIKKILPTSLIVIISALGIALTMSKSGMILFILCLLLIQQNKSKLINITIITIGLILAFQIGIFDNTIARFTGSLTTGRSEKALELQMWNIYPIKFFTGYGLDFAFKYNSIINWASAAFEYPYKKFALELGILSNILIYINIAVYPMIEVIKSKKYTLVIAFLIMFVDINIYNGLAILGDNMLIWCLFSFIIINLSKYIDI